MELSIKRTIWISFRSHLHMSMSSWHKFRVHEKLHEAAQYFSNKNEQHAMKILMDAKSKTEKSETYHYARLVGIWQKTFVFCFKVRVFIFFDSLLH